MHHTKINWKPFKEFRAGDVIVVVSKLDLQRPQYSAKVRFINRDQKHTEFLPLAVDGQGQVYVSRLSGDLHRAMLDAERAVESDAQIAEDRRIQQQIRREEEQLNYGKPVMRKTGKTERERQKRRGG